MKSFAPIFIPTLNRYDHLKRCIESLAKCTHADKTDLYIALDYPANESHWKGYKKIEKYIETIAGFKTIAVVKRKENFGAMKNYFEGRNELFNNNDKIIITEDDNEFSPNFLDYINKGLEKFKNNNRIYTICGYKHPIEIPDSYKANYFFHRDNSAWGFGLWRNKIQDDFYTTAQMKDFIKNKIYLNELKGLSGRHYYNILESIKLDIPRYGDFAVLLNNIKLNQYCVYPVISKIRVLRRI